MALLGVMLLTSCKTDTKKENNSTDTAPSDATTASATMEPEKTESLPEKIAYANGYKNWKDVEELKFTFNVDREGNPHYERSWVWKPKTNEITMMSAEDTLNYNRNFGYWLLSILCGIKIILPLNIRWKRKLP